MKIGNWARTVKKDARCLKSENLPNALDVTEIREAMDELFQESTRDRLERATTLVLDEQQQCLLINPVVGTQRQVRANYTVPKGYTIVGVVHTHPVMPALAFGGGDMAEALFHQHHISIVLSGKEMFAMVRTDMTPDFADADEVRMDGQAALFAYRAEGHTPSEAVYLAALELCFRYGFAMYHGRGKNTIREVFRP